MAEQGLKATALEQPLIPGRAGSDKDSQHEVEPTRVEPPDGGAWAWLVMSACFLVNGIIFGIINTFGILFVELKKEMVANGVEDASAKCSLVGSLTIGTTFFLSFLVGILSDKIGLRATAVLGSCLATTGMGLSALVGYKQVEILYLTYGIMFGAGASLVYTPSLTILGHYFKKRMGIVNGIVTAGSSIFTIGLSFVNQYILEHHGLEPCLQLLASLTSILIICSFTFTPLLPPAPPPAVQNASAFKRLLEKVVYLDNWRNKRFVIWTLAIPLALFGYFVPYVHLPQFARNIPLDEDEERNGEKAASLIMMIGISGGIGRIISGIIADLPSIKRNGNRIILQQVSFVSIGLCTMLLVVAPHFGGNVYEAMMVFCLIMGVFDGCFITMLGPIAFDICGPAGAGQAIGFLLGLCSLPLTVGPPVAGFFYDQFSTYTGAFLGAGVPPIVGAVAMCAIRCFPDREEKEVQDADGKLLKVSETKDTMVENA